MGDSDHPDGAEPRSMSVSVASDEKSVAKPPQAEAKPEAEAISAIEDMPPEMRKTVQAFMAMFQSQARTAGHPLFSKFTEAHIDKYLDYVQRDDDHAYEMAKSNRLFYLSYFVLAMVVLAAAVVYLLPRDRDFLIQIIQFLILLGGGIGAGYGLSKRGKG